MTYNCTASATLSISSGSSKSKLGVDGVENWVPTPPTVLDILSRLLNNTFRPSRGYRYLHQAVDILICHHMYLVHFIHQTRRKGIPANQVTKNKWPFASTCALWGRTRLFSCGIIRCCTGTEGMGSWMVKMRHRPVFYNPGPHPTVALLFLHKCAHLQKCTQLQLFQWYITWLFQTPVLYTTTTAASATALLANGTALALISVLLPFYCDYWNAHWPHM